MKKRLQVLLLTIYLTGAILSSGWAQVHPLPKLSVSRRADTQYMDSLSFRAKQRYQDLNAIPRTATNDTLRFRTLYWLGVLYKGWYGRRDSTVYFANELIYQAHKSSNLFYEINGKLILEEYYHNGQLNTPKALRLNVDILNAIPTSTYYDVVRYRINLNLGDLYRLAKDYTSALHYLNQARQVVKKELVYAGPATTNDFRIDVEQKLGALYQQKGDFSQGEAHLLAAEKLLTDNSSASTRAFIFDDLAELYLKYQHYEQALHYAKKAEAIWDKIKSPGESKSWGTLACIYTGLGQNEQALDYAQRILQLPRPSKFIQEQAYMTLYQLYEHRQDWKSRALYYEKYIAIRDTIASNQSSLELSALQKQNELEQLAFQSQQIQRFQSQRLLTVQKQAELSRLRASSQAGALTRQAQLTEHQRLLERERTQRINATLQRQQTAQKLEQQTFNRETRQQQRIRLWLLIGLTILLLFTVALGLSYRKNQRQQRLIQQLNMGLEQTVQARTAELVTANDELRRANQAIRETDARIIQTQEAERQRIAADLHDDLGGTLSTLRRRLDDIRQQLQDPRAARQFDELEPIIQKSSADLRRIAHNLMPPEFTRLGLHSALEQLVNSQPAQPTRFSFITSGTEHKLPADTELNVYRIVSELIQNINKHAQARRAAVQLLYHPDRLTITVEDDGLGKRAAGSTNKPMGIGLKNSNLRAEYIGATLWRDASEGGTLVVLDIPYQTPNAASTTDPNSAD
ncbi:histidine kinase [Spirosoma spitsbergense]|uniref:histidine kinase n=1 Tax=Spirosoma spitsbergense TaxID=431554 RepID=UPI000379360D|nr:histidine kinase [Spirosoma spitsbergense]